MLHDKPRTSHTNPALPQGTRHVTFMSSHKNECFTRVKQSRYTREHVTLNFVFRTRTPPSFKIWVMLHISQKWMSHVTRMNGARQNSHSTNPALLQGTSHVTHMNASRHTLERVTSRIRMSHVTNMNEVRQTSTLCTNSALSLGMSHATRRSESCHT